MDARSSGTENAVGARFRLKRDRMLRAAAHCFNQKGYSGTSLKDVAERMASQDFDWAVLAISIQREVGGNLAEVLQTVADTMLARNRLKGEIVALTAEGRISAIVLGSLPFALGIFLWFTNRDYLQPLLDATMGRIAIVVELLLMGAGIFWLKKIVDIEI